MRADRLISLLMLLQTRGRQTAAELAEELDVSERTIYRDVEALCASGVPIYTDRGPGGGIALIDSYRTTLTGLTAPETQALMMMSIPAPLAQLGVSQELKAALLKLSAALPDGRQKEEALARQRLHLDWRPDFSNQAGQAPLLQTVQQAVWQDHLLELRYRTDFSAEIEGVFAPYGLVAKADHWFLAAAREGYLRVIRVENLIHARILEQGFTRSTQFDLAEFWESYCEGVQRSRDVCRARVRVAAGVSANALRQMLGPAVDIEPDPNAAEIWLTFDSFYSARARLLGLGGAVEVLEPEPLRLSLQDFARQTLARYATSAALTL